MLDRIGVSAVGWSDYGDTRQIFVAVQSIRIFSMLAGNEPASRTQHLESAIVIESSLRF